MKISLLSNPAVTWKLASSMHVEIALIDVDLPGIDGRDLCHLMRRQGGKVPIILLSLRNVDADIILGLDKGASDFVVQPLHHGLTPLRFT